MQNNNYIVIMAGGIGSRFWPASRSAKPKQFLDILGIGKSLIRLTFERFLPIVPAENVLVVTHADYRDLVKKELPELGDGQILCEPSRQNTAPCVAYAAFKILQRNPNANFVVAPSDHLILKEEAFLTKIKQGLDFVSKNEALLTLGIKPTNPNTGYGYINFDNKTVVEGIFKVKQFTEKPDVATAEGFVAGGEHLWNAGIFLWNVQTLLSAFEKNANAIYAQFEAIAHHLWTDEETTIINKLYPQLDAISVDYAIMEKATNIFTLPADIGWSDIGTWGALHEILEKDEQQNSILHSTEKQVLLYDTNNCLVRSTHPSKLVIIGGLEDYIVVDEEDVLLIYPKQREQEIKPILKEVEERLGGGFS
jgi:mannose-1-phosphate guanylyltransferase